MPKLLKALLVVCTVLPLAWAKNQEYIGRACYPDRSQPSVVGECVESDQCDDDGTFVEDGAGLINPRKDQTKAPINCPSSLTCCLPAAAVPATAVPAPMIHGRSGEEGCGWLQQGIGTALPGWAKPQEVPWTVGIYKPYGTDTSGRPVMEFIANGVLIHPLAVLTVAHKAARLQPAANVYCVVGDHDQRVASVSRKVRQARAVRIHERFNESTAEHNIALIILSQSAVESQSHVAPVCLPPQGLVVDAGTTCFFSGWGKDTQDQHQTLLSKTEVPAVSRSACSAALRPSLGLYYEVQPTLTCAGGVPDTDLCTGGAGSPLVCPVQGQAGRYQLTGLVAYVAACGPLGLPVVFTDVAALRDWIDAQMAAEGLTAPSY